MKTNKTVTRREFLKYAGMTAGVATLAACSPQVVTQIVQQTSIVQQTVAQTSVVEVTPTPAPAIVTPQGLTMPADAASLDKQIWISDGQGEPKFFDGVRDIYNQAGLLLINDTLIHNDENMTTVPSIASSWKAGPNTTYWEFTIQDGYVWSDGTQVTADDVVYTYAHLADPTLANPWVWFYYPIKGVQEVFGGKDASLITDPKTGGVRKVDDKTVRIYGEGTTADGDPCPYMPALLSYQASVITPKAAASKDPEHWADTGVGLISGGPYLCTNWQHNVEIDYDINPKYAGPLKPGIQHVVTPITNTTSNMFNSWLNQECTLLHALSTPQVAQVRADPKLNPLMHFFSNFQTEYVVMDTFNPPLDNLKVRQALSHAIDRDSLCNSVENGTYTPAFSMLPPGFPAYSADLSSIQNYDVTTAQSLMKDAGYDKGAGITLQMYETTENPSKMAFVKSQWETNFPSIKVTLNELESGDWGDKRSKHTMQVYKGPYEYDYVDPANLLTMLFRSSATSAPKGTDVSKWGSPRHPWYNADFDKLCDSAGTETDVTKRMQEYQQAEKILVSDVGVIFLTHQIIFQVWWPWLVGIHADKSGNTVFRWLDISARQMYISKDVDTLKAQYKNA